MIDNLHDESDLDTVPKNKICTLFTMIYQSSKATDLQKYLVKMSAYRKLYIIFE